MTQIEQVKSEIERILNLFPKPHGKVLPIDQNAYNLLGDLKLFIESIPAEQQNYDLKKAAIKEAHKRYRDCPPLNIGGDYEFAECHEEERELFVEGALWGANWQKDKLLAKACEWLKENIYNRVYKCNDGLGFPTAAFLEEFKKAMEE